MVGDLTLKQTMLLDSIVIYDPDHQNCHRQFDEVLYKLYRKGIIKFKGGKYYE